MLTLKYLFEAAGFALLVAAAAVLFHDLYRHHVRGEASEPRWRVAGRTTAAALVPLLVGLAVKVVPAGMAGVRVSQISGTVPGTLHPGLHLIVPLVQRLALYDIRDQLFQTNIAEKAADSLKVQTREGLSVGLAVAVRYRIDPQRLAYI